MTRLEEETRLGKAGALAVTPRFLRLAEWDDAQWEAARQSIKSGRISLSENERGLLRRHCLELGSVKKKQVES